VVSGKDIKVVTHNQVDLFFCCTSVQCNSQNKYIDDFAVDVCFKFCWFSSSDIYCSQHVAALSKVFFIQLKILPHLKQFTMLPGGILSDNI